MLTRLVFEAANTGAAIVVTKTSNRQGKDGFHDSRLKDE
jgi:hypothetical protein